MSEKLLKTFYQVEVKHWWWIGRRNILKKFLSAKNDGKQHSILDAGCGTGSTIQFLNDYGVTYGVDVSSVATAFCRKRGLKNIKTGDVSKLPYDDNFFDIVSCMDVLEHIEDENKAVKELYRVLKPGGELILTVPGLPFIFSEHDKAQGHFRRYSRNDVRELLESNGFREKRTTHFNVFLSLPIVIIRLLSRFKPFAKAADFDSKLNYDIYKMRILNDMLSFIFSLEAILLQKTDLPFGVSILAIYQKPLGSRKKK
jgi:ubiquinone/menaquinone biosynthesis C-methylase UbiE